MLRRSSLRENNRSPRSIVIFFFFQNDVLLFTRETCLRRVRSSLRANNRSHRSIIHQFIRFPLLRRPEFYQYSILSSLMSVLFQRVGGRSWLGVTADNRFHRSIIHLSLGTQRTLTFLSGFPRAFCCSRWQSWWSPFAASRNQTHHWSWLRCDSFFTWFFVFFSTSLQNTLQNWNG